jgi:hypothetical protein
MVFIKVSILVVIFTPQFRKLLFKGLEHRPLNDHETRGSIENFDKSVLNGAILGSEVDNEARGKHGHVAFIPILDSIRSLIPHDNLFGIAGNREVVTGFYKAYNSFGIKVDVSVDEHEVLTVSLLHETTYRNITGTMDERFIFSRIKEQLNTLLDEEELEFDDTGHILLET